MTRKQRAQVVELLRCAADYVDRSCIPIWNAAHATSEGAIEAHRTALDALDAVRDLTNRKFRILEAAARVEEGSYP